MATPVDTAERVDSIVARHGGRRWKENPILTDVVSRVLLGISRDVYGLREHL